MNSSPESYGSGAASRDGSESPKSWQDRLWSLFVRTVPWIMYPLNKFAKYFGTVLFLAIVGLILGNAFGASLGVDNLFQDSQHLIDRAVTDGVLVLRNSPSLLTSLGLLYLCYLVILFSRSSWHRAAQDAQAQRHGFWREVWRVVPWTLAVYAAGMAIWLFIGREVQRPCDADLILADCGRSLRDNPRVAWGLGFEIVRLIIGGLLGLALIFATQWLIWDLGGRLVRWKTGLDRDIQARTGVVPNLIEKGKTMSWLQRIAAYLEVPKVWEYLLAVLLVGGPVLAVFLLSRIVPALAVFAALGTGYIAVRILLDMPLFIRFLVAATVAVLLSVPHDAFKLQFDGIPTGAGKSHYVTPLDLNLVDAGIGKNTGNRINPVTCQTNETRFEPVDPLGSLIAWRDHQRKLFGHEKPKLVLVATSGGAYRSAYWTAMIMERLARQSGTGEPLEGFTAAVRLITGASGGMIGAAYFTVLSEPHRQAPLGGSFWPDTAEYAKTFARDLPVYTSPHTKISEQINQDIWQAQIHDAKGGGGNLYTTRYPVPRDSLSPVVQHMLQVDLPSILWPSAVDLDRGKVLERQWRRLNIPFNALRVGEQEGWRPSIIFSPALVETGQPLVISNLDLTFLPRFDRREAMSFFNMFPCSHGSFNLATAARMNATFPLISPAVSLPTVPERRVVDAGFYDNYGVSLAAAYLGDPEVNAWIKENTSGVIVLQLRAFPLGTAAPRHCLAPSPETDGGLLEGFEWITSPIEAVFSARGSTMVFRNEQELRNIQRLYPEGFVDTVIFTNSSPVSMNWILPEDEAKAMRACLDEQWNDNLSRLKALWYR